MMSQAKIDAVVIQNMLFDHYFSMVKPRIEPGVVHRLALVSCILGSGVELLRNYEVLTLRFLVS